MYPFSKKHRQQSRIRLDNTHVVRCYKGRCLVACNEKSIAVWLDTHEVAKNDQYIEFNIDHDKIYFVSELYRMLMEDDYHHEDETFKGAQLLPWFLATEQDDMMRQNQSNPH